MKIYKESIDVSPEEVGYNPEAIVLLDNHFQKLIEESKIQAAGYLLARNGKIIAHHTMGKLSSFEDKGDFMPDSLRPIASITKVITTTGILQLLEQGKLYLRQPVSSMIKEFDTDMHRQITIFHLLTHTSGLRSDPGSYFEPYPESWDKSNWNKENWIKKILEGTLQYKIGTVWNYCSKGFSILAEIISRVSGMDYDDYVKENIFKPLEMNNSFFIVPDNYKDKVCVISDWNKEKSNSTKADMISPSMWGAGGAVSSLKDLWKLGQMMLNNGQFNGVRILGRKTVESAIKPQKKNITAHNWLPNMFDDSFKWTCGLGWELNKHSFLTDGTFDHEGAGGSDIFIDPVENFIYVGFFPGTEWCPEAWTSPLAIAWSGIE